MVFTTGRRRTSSFLFREGFGEGIRPAERANNGKEGAVLLGEQTGIIRDERRFFAPHLPHGNVGKRGPESGDGAFCRLNMMMISSWRSFAGRIESWEYARSFVAIVSPPTYVYSTPKLKSNGEKNWTISMSL